MKKISLFLIVSFLFGCSQTKKDVDQVTNIRGGRCYLQKDGNAFFCIDFNSNGDSNAASSSCDSEKSRYSANGISFLSGSGNTCDSQYSTTKVGKCTRSDGVINYYDTSFSASTAQTDCTTIHNGTWATP